MLASSRLHARLRTAGFVVAVVLPACGGARSAPRSAPAAGAPEPTTVPALGRLAAGFDFTCALRDDATVACWGRNHRGQLGRGGVSPFDGQAKRVADVDGVVEIGAGGEHACARTKDGRIACWGVDDAAVDTTQGVRPAPVFFPTTFGAARSMAVGARHLCFVTANATAACLGWGSDGQLGDGATMQRTVPHAVFGLDGPVSVLSAGEAHTCGVVAGGGLFCWGSARDGRLGDGATQTYAMQTTATPVEHVTAATVAAGGRMTCAVTRAASVMCWGRHMPGRRLSDDDPAEVFATPFVVPTLEHGARAVAVGHTHACAIRDLGTLVCWGWNESGQLGDGTTNDAATPREVQLPEPAREVAAGRQHTCARVASGAVYCWGYGAFGQLGQGTTDSSTRPVRVTSL